MRIDGMNTLVKTGDINVDKVHTAQKTTPAGENNIDISEKMLIKTIEKANEKLVIANRALEFSIHEKTKEIIVKVIDVETKEVIREIPSEKILDLIANILELAGILVDERR
ncbi:flagellar protein FlaG [Thermoclostridium stercorarium]|nr:flagellar protein FlaG [Thermoclostridium stercorarium]AGI40482.1 FlaG [Thermoclostridium stercorarium subsp. stercorarium DSM 8532]UZQ85470.1 flagellar protein FlaG [Thermoclostridium stercorarium]